MTKRPAFIVVALAAISIVTGSFLVAANASSGSVDLMRIEGVRLQLDTLHALPQAIETDLKASHGDRAADETPHLEQVLRQSFDIDAVAESVRAAIDALPEPEDTAVYGEVAGKIDARLSEWKAASSVGGADFIKAAEVAYKERPDAARLSELASSMGAPDLSVELALVRSRLQALAAKILLDGPDELATYDAEQRAQGIAQLFDKMRTESGPESETARRTQFARQNEIARQTIILLALEPEEISRLLDTFKSEPGKARRDAMIRAFRDRLEADTRNAALAYMALVSPVKG